MHVLTNNDANPLSHTKLFAAMRPHRKGAWLSKKGLSICIAFGSLASLPLTTCKFGMSIWDIRKIYSLVDDIHSERVDASHIIL